MRDWWKEKKNWNINGQTSPPAVWNRQQFYLSLREFSQFVTSDKLTGDYSTMTVTIFISCCDK